MTSKNQAHTDHKIKPMRVLLVEDSALLRERVTESVSEFDNVKVEDIAMTQQEAILLLETNSYDMIIADIELAQGNGLEVIKYTHSASFKHKKPVCIILTNHTYSHYRKVAKDLGVDYFFDKSMDFDAAIDSIGQEASHFCN